MTARPLITGIIFVVSIQATQASEFLDCKFTGLDKKNSVTYELTGDQLLNRSEPSQPSQYPDMLATDRKIVRNDEMGLIAVGDLSIYVKPTNHARMSNLGANVFFFDRSNGNAHIWMGRMYDGAIDSANGACASRKGN